MKKFLLPILFSLTVAPAAFAPMASTDGPYHFIKEIPVAGETGWDYLSVDPLAHRLYVSHGIKVVVIDLVNDTVAGEITNTPGVHGLAVAPRLQRGFTSNDSILFEPRHTEVYVFNGRDDSATVIDAKTATVVATIPLGGRPEFAADDPRAGLVFDNLEDKDEVAVIDTATHTVTNLWPIAPGEEGSGMAIDVKHHRLFIGCGGSHTMLMMDGLTGKVLASVPTGEGVDANAFDPGTQLAFASCGDGTTTIAHEAGDTLTVVQTLPTEKSARTMALDPTTHKIYLASAKFDAPAEGQRRGKMVPGTFKILVYGMDK
jgi:YVTN family beta-propeller protein